MLSPSGRIAGVHKIAVLRANGVGDYIFVIPALEALRAAYPDAEIVLLGKQWHADFISGRPGPVDRVVVVPRYAGVNDDPSSPEDPIEREDFFRRMRDERFDLAFQLHGGGRNSNPFVARLGARVTLGLKTPDAPALDRWVPYLYWQREILRYLEVVTLAGAKPVSIDPALMLTPSDRAEAASVVPFERGPMIAIHPGVSDPERGWPPEKFAAVADALAETGASIILTGADGERAAVDAAKGYMRSSALDLCGRVSLGGLAGLLARCRLVIANDSGPLNLAYAVGTAAVGIYWHFNLVTAGPMTTARHVALISWQVHCPVCGIDRSQRSCEHHPSFVASVKAEHVLDAARFLLADGAPASEPLTV